MRQPTDKRQAKADDEQHAILLRLPVPLHQRLKRMAGEQRRSVHSEALFAIEAWVDDEQSEAAA